MLTPGVHGQFAEHLLQRGPFAVQFPQHPATRGRKVEDLRAKLVIARRLETDARASIDGLGRLVGHTGQLLQRLGDAIPLGLDGVAGDATSGVHQLGHGAVGRDGALRDDQQPVAGGLHLLHDVRAQDDRAVAPEGAHQVADLDALVGIEPFGRLVQDEDFGLMQDRAGHSGALPESLRDFAYGPEEDLLQARLLHRPFDPRPARGVVHAAQPRDVFQEFADEHVVVERVRFGQVSDARLGARQVVRDRPAVEPYGALVGLQRPRQHAHGGGLSGPVWSQEAHHFPSLHLETGPVDRHDGAVTLGDPLHGYHPSSFVAGRILFASAIRVQIPSGRSKERLSAGWPGLPEARQPTLGGLVTRTRRPHFVEQLELRFRYGLLTLPFRCRGIILGHGGRGHGTARKDGGIGAKGVAPVTLNLGQTGREGRSG